MLRGVVLMALTACGFQSSLQPIDAAPESPRDAPVNDAPGPPKDAALDASLPPLCEPSDALMACYAFEGTFDDASPHQLHPMLIMTTAMTAGRVGFAMVAQEGTIVDVPDSPVFDVTALTIEAWVLPSELPQGDDRGMILDVNAQYNMFLRRDGSVGCSLVNGGSFPSTGSHVTVGQWAHLACTYDGATGAIYIDGVRRSTSSGDKLGAGGRTGMSLGSDNDNDTPGRPGTHLIGLLDEVRLMSVARTAEQICADAGRTSCL